MKMRWTARERRTPLSPLPARERVASSKAANRERISFVALSALSPPLRGDPLPQAGEGKTGDANKKTAAHGARRLRSFVRAERLFLHVFVRQMTRRIFGSARLALHVPGVHALTRRIFRRASRCGGALTRRELRLAGLV